MLARVVAALLIASTAPALAQSAPKSGQRQSFEQRVVAVLNQGGPIDQVQGRLDRVAADSALSADQRTALEAVRTLVRGKAQAKGLRLADADAFAARNPGSPAASMLIGEAALAADEPQRSADAFIAAARGGEMVQLISPTTVSRLVDRLDELVDKDRTLALAKALVGSGWSRGSANLRSFLAMEVIRSAMASGRTDEARRALSAVTQPSALRAILIDNRFAALRPDVEAIAGPRLERHWRAYLAKAKDDWLAGGDYLSATAYAAALQQAGYHQTFVDTFLPRFMHGYNCPTDQVSRALGQDIAESLVMLGRWTKADDIISRAGGMSVGAYAGILLEKGEYGRAASYFDRALKTAKPAADKADEKARAWLAAVRDCASYRARRVQPVLSFDPDLLDLPSRLRVALCLDRTDQARDFLIAALRDEEERSAALKWVQPYSEPPTASAFHKEIGSRIRALQHDPAVLAEVQQHGLILDWPLEASAPPESDFRGGPVRRASPCNIGWSEDLMGESLRNPQDLYEKNSM